MESIFSRDIQAGLDAARQTGARSRLSINLQGRSYPVLRMWKTGFAIAAQDAPHLRGLVDLYEGPKHLFQCLIVAMEPEEGEMRYAFKRATSVTGAAPLDFEKRESTPVGLIEAP